jgi:hypothetical protein
MACIAFPKQASAAMVMPYDDQPHNAAASATYARFVAVAGS